MSKILKVIVSFIVVFFIISSFLILLFNFSSPNYMAEHYSLDVLPHNQWGNVPNDTISWLGRRIGVVD